MAHVRDTGKSRSSSSSKKPTTASSSSKKPTNTAAQQAQQAAQRAAAQRAAQQAAAQRAAAQRAAQAAAAAAAAARAAQQAAAQRAAAQRAAQQAAQRRAAEQAAAQAAAAAARAAQQAMQQTKNNNNNNNHNNNHNNHNNNHNNNNNNNNNNHNNNHNNNNNNHNNSKPSGGNTPKPTNTSAQMAAEAAARAAAGKPQTPTPAPSKAGTGAKKAIATATAAGVAVAKASTGSGIKKSTITPKHTTTQPVHTTTTQPVHTTSSVSTPLGSSVIANNYLTPVQQSTPAPVKQSVQAPKTQVNPAYVLNVKPKTDIFSRIATTKREKGQTVPVYDRATKSFKYKSVKSKEIKNALKKAGITLGSYSNSDVRPTYDVDASGSNVHAVTAFQVNTVNSTTYKNVSNGLQDGSYEVWVLTDDDSIKQTKPCTYNYTDPNTGKQRMQVSTCNTIGRKRLRGIDVNDKYVIYDPVSKRFFKYAQNDAINKYLEKQQALLNAADESRVAAMRSASHWGIEAEQLEGKLTKYITTAQTRPLTNKEYKEFQELYKKYEEAKAPVEGIYNSYQRDYTNIIEQYHQIDKQIAQTGGITGKDIEEYSYLKTFVDAAERIKQGKGDELDRQLLTAQYHATSIPKETMARYYALQNKIHAAKNNYVYMNKDYIMSVNKYVDSLNEGMQTYERLAAAHANIDSRTQVNSFADVLKRSVSRAIWKQYTDTSPLQDIAEAFSYKTKSVYDAATTANATMNSVATAALAGALTELGETLDMTNVFKPIIVGSQMYRYGNYDDAAYGAWLRSQAEKEWQNASARTRNFFGNANGGADNGIANYAGWVAFKAALGAYGETPNFDYINTWAPEDRDARAYLLTTVADMLLDPGFLFDATQGLVKNIARKDLLNKHAVELLNAQYKLWQQAGAVIIRDADKLGADTVARVVADNAAKGIITVVKSADTDEKILKAYSNALKHAVDAGGESKAFLEELTNAAIKTSTQTFTPLTGLRKLAHATDTPAHVADALEYSARTAYNKALNEFTQRTASNAVTLFKNSVTEEGALAARLAFDVPSIVKTMHSIDDAQQFLNKALMAASAPVLSAPVLVGRGLRRLLAELPNSSKHLTVDAVGAYTDVASKLANAPQYATASNLNDVLDEISKSISVYTANTDLSEDAVKLFNAFDKTALAAYTGRILENTLMPVRRILQDVTKDNVQAVLKNLDRFANTMGFDTYADAHKALMQNIGLFVKNNPDAKKMFMWYQRKYTDALLQADMDKVSKVFKAFKTPYDDVRKIYAVLNNTAILTTEDVTTLHTAVQHMRDIFFEEYGHVSGISKAQYAEYANTAISKIVEVGDGIASATELVAPLQQFLETTEDYLKGVRTYLDDLKHSTYRTSDISEYVKASAERFNTVARESCEVVSEGIRKELQAHHGLNVDAAEVKNKLLHTDIAAALKDAATGQIDAATLQRVYQVQLDKYTDVLQYVDDPTITRVTEDIIDPNTSTRGALEYLLDALSNTANKEGVTDEVIRACMEARASLQSVIALSETCHNTRVFYKTFEREALENGVSSSHINAVLDAFSGDKTGLINSNAEKWALVNNPMFIENIVETVTQNATEYLRQISDRPIDYLWHYKCNTVDTAKNIERIKELAATRVPADDQYIDVYYSCAGTVRGADPHMVSFSTGDRVETFRNASSMFRLHDSHAYHMYGMSAEDVTQAYAEVCNKYAGVPREQYVKDIQTYLIDIQQRAAAENKQLRFIGFNAGAATSETDRFIKHFLTSNGITIRWNSTVDVGEIIRVAEGYATLEDGAVMAIRRAVRDTLEEASVLKHAEQIQLVLDPDSGILDKLYHAKNAIAETARRDVAQVATDAIDELISGVRNIDAFRFKVLGDNAKITFSERQIAEFIEQASYGKDSLTRINSMRALYGILPTATSVTSGSLQIKKVFDGNLVREWFSDDTINSLLRTKDNKAIAHSADELYSFVKQLDLRYSTIQNTELLEQLGVDALRNTYNAVYTVAARQMMYKAQDELLQMYSNLVLKTPQDYYAALSMLIEHVDSKSVSDLLIQACANTTTEVQNTIKNIELVLDVLTHEDDIVYNVAHNVRSYDTYIPALETKYLSASEKTSYALALEDGFRKAAKDAESLGTYLDLKEALYTNSRLLTADERMNYALYKRVYTPYRDLMTRIDNMLNPADIADADAVVAARTKAAFDDRVSTVNTALKGVTHDIAEAGTDAILMLSDEQFEQFVVRNCMNALIIDPSSSLFKGDAGVLLGARLKSLVNNPKVGLKVETFKYAIGDTEKELIRVYKDLQEYTPAQLDELLNAADTADLPLYSNYIVAARNKMTSNMLRYQEINEYVQEYLHEMTAYMPAHYFVSSYDVLTQDTIKRMQELFPEASRLNVARIDKWFDESYCCNIWGDLDLKHTLNPYASEKLLDNMGRGLHHVQHKLEATTNLMRVFTDKSQSLRNILKESQSAPDWNTVKKQLDARGYVLATLTPGTFGYSVKQCPITSEKVFKEYLKTDDVVCMEGAVYNAIKADLLSKQRTAMYTKFHGSEFASHCADMYLEWKRTFRSARITSALFASNIKATGIRNIIDSTVKGFNDAGLAFLKHIPNAIEYQRAYDEVYAQIYEEFKHVDADTILAYYSQHAEHIPLTQELFEKLHVFNELASTGMSALLDITKNNQLSKMRSLLNTDAYTDAELQAALDTFNRVLGTRKYRNIPGTLKDTVQSQIYADVFDALQHLKEPGTTVPRFTLEQCKELAPLVYKYTPTANTWGHALEQTPLLGKLIQFNSKTFENAEIRTRTALYLAYMEEDVTTSAAEKAIIRTQFDYSNAPLAVGALETLFPFTTFKIYNSQYWVRDAASSITNMKLITRYGNAVVPVHGTWEIAQQIRNTLTAQALAEDRSDDDTSEENATGIRGWFADNILGYKGVSESFADGIRIGDNHYVKVGNSFTDAIRLGASIFYAPMQIAQGQLPSILSDSVYAPLGTLYKFMSDLNTLDIFGRLLPTNGVWNNDPEALGELTLWAEENYRSIFDLIPAYGMAVNLVFTHIRTAVPNLADMKLMLCDKSLQRTWVARMFQTACDLSSTVFPSFVGVLNKYNNAGGAMMYFERPIGLNWYANTDVDLIKQRINPATGKHYTDEEAKAFSEAFRSTHQRVLGVSTLPAWMCKDPATYIDYAAMFLKMGFDEKDVENSLKEVLQQLYGGGLINDPHTNGIYINAVDGVRAYLDYKLLEDTFSALAARGYTIEEAIEMLKKQKWLDPVSGTLYSYNQVAKTLDNSMFLRAYNALPDYVKYDKEQYAALVAYWKANGLTTEQALLMIQREHGYIDEAGRYRVLTDAQVAAYNKQLNDDYYEFVNQLPTWYKYEPGAASRAINLFVQRGMSVQEAQEYILKHNVYVDVDGKVHYLTDAEVAARAKTANTEFYDYYETLPDYIKYEKGAYGRTLRYLKSLGISEKDAKRMIKNGAYYTIDGRLINCSGLQRVRKQSHQKMSDEEWNNYFQSLPDYTKYEKGAFKRIYAYLKAQGYKHDMILEFIRNGFYISADGKIIQDVRGMQRPVLGYATFNDYYQSLPNYIKYEKGAYRRTYDALRMLGFTYEQSLSLIKQGAYLSETAANSIFNSAVPKAHIPVTDIHSLLQKYAGVVIRYGDKTWTLIDCSGLNRTRGRRSNYNTSGRRYVKKNYQRKKYTPYPKREYTSRVRPKQARPKQARPIKHRVHKFYIQRPYVTHKSYSSTYSKVNMLAGASYGARKVFKVTLGYNPVRQSLSIKSTYPAAYRNIVYSTRRSLYKELYAKYGASRMLMRSNVTHMYSNACITRLRRNEIFNRVKYGNRRNNL